MHATFLAHKTGYFRTGEPDQILAIL